MCSVSSTPPIYHEVSIYSEQPQTLKYVRRRAAQAAVPVGESRHTHYIVKYKTRVQQPTGMRNIMNGVTCDIEYVNRRIVTGSEGPVESVKQSQTAIASTLRMP